MNEAVKAILFTAVSALGSMVVLFVLAKLMGSKQIAQLTTFDYITGITIGSIAAELATELEAPWQPLTALAVTGVLTYLYSLWERKSETARKFADDFPLLLLNNGKLYRENFSKANLNLGDFLAVARENGYFDISGVKTALLEQNGLISFLPFPDRRPATPSDLNIQPPPEAVCINVIVDGELLEANLITSGKNRDWLEKALVSQGYPDIKAVFLATLNRNFELSVYPVIKGSVRADWFE